MVRLLLTLRYFATGSYLTSTGDFVGVSSASACRFIKDVCEALVRLRSSFICFPTDMTPLKQGFYNLAGFPRVVGAIDCTHVAVSPRNGGDVERYRNKEGVLSKNVQIICDADLMIRDIVARWPGSTIDQTVFDNSLIKVRFDAGEFDDSILLGDTDYQSQPYLFTPLEQTSTPAENLYNEAHILSRNVVERCVDALKSRFPVLRKRVTLSVERTGDIIVACAVLHNLAVRMKDKHFQFIREQPPDMNQQEPNNDPHIDPRRQLILDHFTSLVKQEVAPH